MKQACVCVSGVYQDKIGRLVVGQEDGQVEKEGVGGGIHFPGDLEPVLQVFQHGSRAHVGWVEATKDQGLQGSVNMYHVTVILVLVM